MLVEVIETLPLAREYVTLVEDFDRSRNARMPSQAALQDIDPKWAWAPFEPTKADPWEVTRASHLCRRVSFGATWSELQQAVAAGPAKTIERLITGDVKTGDMKTGLAKNGGKTGDNSHETFYREAAATAASLTSDAENLPG